jgi:hypothetical protein
VAFEAFALDPLERVGKIDVARARFQMDLVAIMLRARPAHGSRAPIVEAG